MKYILIIFFREVFSDYFEPTNVLYKDAGSHNGITFINKYIGLIRVKPSPSTRGLHLHKLVPTGNLIHI